MRQKPSWLSFMENTYHAKWTRLTCSLSLLLSTSLADATEYRDVLHRSGDQGSTSPDALERQKGLRFDATRRQISVDGTYLKTAYHYQGQAQQALVSWQTTPSLWFALAVVEQTDSFDSSRAMTDSLSHTLAPSLAFKIMDRLILGYRYVAWQSDHEEAYFHQTSLRWKGESLELAYDQAWRLAPGTKRQSGGIEARWRIQRGLVARWRYARENLPWSQGPLAYADRLVTSIGALAQVSAWTIAAEFRRDQPEASGTVYIDALSGTVDYEWAERYSLGVTATKWFKPRAGEAALEGHEIGARVGWRL